jgi:hypothetical protein
MRRVPTLRVLELADLAILGCLAVPAAVSTNGVMHATPHPVVPTEKSGVSFSTERLSRHVASHMKIDHG